MAIRRVSPGFGATHAKAVHGASLAGIASLLTKVMVMQRTARGGVAADGARGGGVHRVGPLAGPAFGWLVRLSREDDVTVGIGFAVRNVALASAFAITFLNRIEYAVFAVVYFFTEVPLLLVVVVAYRARWAPATQLPGLPDSSR